MPDSGAGGASKASSKAARRRAQIQRAAAELFSRQSFLDTTMDEIAAEAGVSKGGMYYHYRKKSDVLFDIQREAMEDLLEGLDEALAHCGSARGKLDRFVRRQLHYYAGHLPQVRTLLNDRHCLEPAQARAIGTLQKRYFDYVRALVREATGRDDTATVNAIAFGLFGLCNWIPGWYREDGAISIDALADATARLFLEGLDGFKDKGEGT